MGYFSVAGAVPAELPISCDLRRFVQSENAGIIVLAIGSIFTARSTSRPDSSDDEVVTVNAVSMIRLLESIEGLYPLLVLIHVFLDNARYHYARLVQEWLARPGCRIKLHFIPSYCPHLNPIEGLWGLMRWSAARHGYAPIRQRLRSRRNVPAGSKAGCPISSTAPWRLKASRSSPAELMAQAPPRSWHSGPR
jgi:DDE superfamily endonuclease